MIEDSVPQDEPTLEIPFSIEQWEQYPLAIHGKRRSTFLIAFEKTLAQLSRLLPSIKKSSKILVLSSGNSFVASYIVHTHGCNVDLHVTDEAAEKRALKEISGSHVEEKVHVSVNPIEALILERSHYDIVFSVGELYNIDDTLKIFKDVARSLAPEGRFIMLEVFDTFKDEIELSGYENITTIDNYLRRARRADLERVYAKEYSDKTIKHYSVIVDELSSAKKVSAESKKRANSLLELAKNASINWGIVQLQKRND